LVKLHQLLHKKNVLFIPSNKNHVQLFYKIFQELPKDCSIFLSQEPYKKEGSETELNNLRIKFKKLGNYSKKDPSFILDREKVGVIVVGNDTDIIPQWFINHSKKMNISSVLIQDGLMFESLHTQNSIQNLFHIFNKSNMRLLFLELSLLLKHQYKRIRDGESGCTQIQVWGKTSEKYFLSLGINKDKIVITGPLQKYDSEYTPQHLKDDERKILFTLSDLVDTKIMTRKGVIKLIDTVCSVTTTFEKMKLIIKPHPREKQGIYENHIKKFGSKVEISYQAFNELMITNSDLLITNLSTTAIEALVFKKPTIIFLPNIENIVNHDVFPRDLIKKNIIKYAKDKDTLSKQLTLIINDNLRIDYPETEKALRDYLGTFEEDNAKKSAQLILHLLNKAQKS